MASSPNSVPVSVSLDPTGIVPMLTAGFTFGAKLCDLAMTPEGQATLKTWRENTQAFNTSIADGVNKVIGFFQSLDKNK